MSEGTSRSSAELLSALIVLVCVSTILGVGMPEVRAQNGDRVQVEDSQSPDSKVVGEPAGAVHPAGRANRLAAETSPYLRLHAHNPVDWYPWGPEALEKAAAEQKPIFLSIGYSSCYWCHVMERRVFSDPKIAQYMNEHFINIKVDREERPDVDDIYMTSLIIYQQAAGLRGGGGWPLSMFLTPDGDPFAGATYLPPEDQDGRLGFLSVARRISDIWETHRDSVEANAKIIVTEVRRLSAPGLMDQAPELSNELIQASLSGIVSQFDPVWGGVDFDPRDPEGARFPNIPRLMLVLNQYQSSEDGDQRQKLKKVLERSLHAMAEGGIRDHLAGGFHRYSTDRRWHVPHFEKMLYDQALFLQLYSRAAVELKEPSFENVVAEIVQYVQSDLISEDGAYYSARDAETNAVEGLYYVWSEDELINTLGPDGAALFAKVYGTSGESPFEHGYVLRLARPFSTVADETSTSLSELTTRIADMRQRLLSVRAQRPAPLLDNKILTDWNAMLISGLTASSRLPGRQGDLRLAVRTGDFLWEKLRSDDGSLMHSWCQGRAAHAAYLDDYAFLCQAFIDLHETTGDEIWKKRAVQVMDQLVSGFFDEDLATFYFTGNDHEKLISRISNGYDSVYPSGNSVTIRALLRLHQLTGNKSYRDIADRTMRRFASSLQSTPAACAGLALALSELLTATPAHSAQAQERLSPSELNQCAAPDEDQTSADESKAGADGNEDEMPVEHRVFRPISASTDEAGTADEKAQKPVQAKVFMYFDKLERGGRCPIAVELKIHPEWHINANPPEPDILVPVQLEVNSKAKIKLTGVRYPKHKELEVDGLDEKYHVYDGTVMLYGVLETEATETISMADLTVRIKFQACNEKTCMRPDEIAFAGKVTLVDPGTPVKVINRHRFPQPKKSAEPELDPAP
ncbi:MAG: thioredoxin domain-containing protein [Planctomycetaceae bacterium]|nr:thioredoxin domain-containing protein [Planctomycetaceae bacterium]